MTIAVERKLFAAAVKALGLDVPIYAAWMEGETVCVSTRNGVQRWTAEAKAEAKPRAPARKVTKKKPKPKAKAKSPSTAGGAKKKTGVKK
jgi:hypothetical protein